MGMAISNSAEDALNFRATAVELHWVVLRGVPKLLVTLMDMKIRDTLWLMCKYNSLQTLM